MQMVRVWVLPLFLPPALRPSIPPFLVKKGWRERRGEVFFIHLFIYLFMCVCVCEWGVGGRRREGRKWKSKERRSRPRVKKGAGGEAETPYPMREDGEGRKDAIERGRKKKLKKEEP